MASKVPFNCSFVLCWSQNIVEKGTRWQVGDGQTIEVFKDAWIPTLSSGKLISEAWNERQTKVRELFGDDQNWDIRRLKEFLIPCEILLVNNIDLTKRQGSDKSYWLCEENGDYLVKLGYGVEMGKFESHQSLSNNTGGNWWNEFWKLNVPPKVKIFGWKLFHDYITVEMQLRLHHVPVLGICWWCRKDWGSMAHCIYFCSTTRSTWKATKFWTGLRCCQGLSTARNYVENVVQRG